MRNVSPNNVWEQLTSEIAEGLLFLAHFHKEHKLFDHAVKYCGRLYDYNGPVRASCKTI
jgi:hypothetical protein